MTATIGTTIHDEIVTVVGRKVRLDGHTTWTLATPADALAKAREVVPAHRRAS